MAVSSAPLVDTDPSSFDLRELASVRLQVSVCRVHSETLTGADYIKNTDAFHVAFDQALNEALTDDGTRALLDRYIAEMGSYGVHMTKASVDLSRARWRKSTRSGGAQQCVEVVREAAWGALRDSKNPNSCPITLSATIVELHRRGEGRHDGLTRTRQA